MDPLLEHQGIVVSRAHYIVAINIVSALILLSTAPASLAAVTDRVFIGCNSVQFNSNETFADNFNAVVQSLTQNSSKTLYSNASSVSGSNSSYAYGIYQCRGDVSLSDCSSCVSNCLWHIQTDTGGCGYFARGARAQCKGCYVRYEDYAFYSGFEKDGDLSRFSICSPWNNSSPVYQQNVATALNNTARAAPKHALFGYNASSVGTGSSTAYALSQCLGYLSPSKCATCLSGVSDYSRKCNNAVSGQAYFNDCFYLYDNTSFLFTDIFNSTSSANPPSPQRSLGIASSTQERSNKQSNTTAIIVGIVEGTTLAIAIIITLALCYLKRIKKTASNYKLRKVPLHATSEPLP